MAVRLQDFAMTYLPFPARLGRQVVKAATLPVGLACVGQRSILQRIQSHVATTKTQAVDLDKGRRR